MPPKTALWEMEPHTAAKHTILRRYVQVSVITEFSSELITRIPQVGSA